MPPRNGAQMLVYTLLLRRKGGRGSMDDFRVAVNEFWAIQ